MGVLGGKLNILALGSTLAGAVLLLATDLSEAATLASRLVPIFVFVIGMSVVVNIAAQIGVFDVVTQMLEHVAPASASMRQHALWAGLILLSIIVTVFLSLDTTAILLTPLAVAVAKRNGLNLMAVSLAVVWIANIASLPLPVSNLTNLLALSGQGFSTATDYISQALLPGLVAIAVVVVASWAVYARSPVESERTLRPSPARMPGDPLLLAALITLGMLLPALASPIPYWISSTVAAVVLFSLSAVMRRDLISFSLVPWPSLLLATALSTVATAVNSLGGAETIRALLGAAEQSSAGLFAIAAAGALASNLINNIPAFLALEPAVNTSTGYLALLIGVNAGPLITPWASLATLLWHDQLVRAGVVFRWRTYMMLGVVLTPFALLLPTAALAIQVI
ncbi:SLC13 family permease [Corynebacterium sp. A21]|uniref:SLC13 family permease n=1 Tax=Corynebacterium sp. A21 TaxID=3457318 RepID=UPI003FD3B218